MSLCKISRPSIRMKISNLVEDILHLLAYCTALVRDIHYYLFCIDVFVLALEDAYRKRYDATFIAAIPFDLLGSSSLR